jgi:hypothetical protein
MNRTEARAARDLIGASLGLLRLLENLSDGATEGRGGGALYTGYGYRARVAQRC